jgi:hypothetical protein
MVKGSSEIIYGISRNHGELMGERAPQAQFVNCAIRLVRVWLRNDFAGANFQESADIPFQFGDVFPTPFEFLMSTSERIRHEDLRDV